MYKVQEKDKPFYEAVKALAGDNVTSHQIEAAVAEVVRKNYNQGIYEPFYTGQDVIRMMVYFDLINIRSHLGQPRHGRLINGGRLHTIKVY